MEQNLQAFADSVAEALVKLGYDAAQAREAVRRAMKTPPNPLTIEALLKQSLHNV